MFRYKPIRLSALEDEISRIHRRTFSSLSSGDITSLHLGQALAERLLQTEDKALSSFLKKLTRLERIIFCGLLNHKSEEVQARVLAGLSVDPDLAKPDVLWNYFENRYSSRLGLFAGRLLHQIPRLRKNLTFTQNVFCEALVSDDLDERLIFWAYLQNVGKTADEFYDPQSYHKGSALDVALQRAFYHHGWFELWQAIEPAHFKGRLELLSQEDLIQTMIRAWEMNIIEEKKTGSYWVAHFVRLLGARDSPLWKLLEDTNYEAFVWYRSYQNRLNLRDFFEKFPDSERLKYWEKHIPNLRYVMGDVENLRLFLDFGTFGVVEFAEKGNAAYFYTATTFAYFQELNRRRKPTSHSELKDRDKGLSMIHNKSWQRKFDRTIRNLLNNLGK